MCTCSGVAARRRNQDAVRRCWPQVDDARLADANSTEGGTCCVCAVGARRQRAWLVARWLAGVQCLRGPFAAWRRFCSAKSACMCACVRACACACVCVRVCACVYMCVCVCAVRTRTRVWGWIWPPRGWHCAVHMRITRALGWVRRSLFQDGRHLWEAFKLAQLLLQRVNLGFQRRLQGIRARRRTMWEARRGASM